MMKTVLLLLIYSAAVATAPPPPPPLPPPVIVRPPGPGLLPITFPASGIRLVNRSVSEQGNPFLVLSMGNSNGAF